MITTVTDIQIQDELVSIFGGENAVSNIYCQPHE